MKILKSYGSVLLFAVLTILCIAFIFGQSLKSSAVSNEESDRVIEVVRPILDPEEEMTEKEADFVVRKGAHLTEFAVLGLCLGGFSAALWGASGRHYPFLGPFLALVVGVTDEYLQSFLDRTSQVQDVLIDFIGALLGLLLAALAAGIWRRIRKATPS